MLTKEDVSSRESDLSHTYKIIIRPSEDDLILDRQTYDKEILQSEITKDAYSKIINDAEKVISDSWIKKRKYESIKVPLWVYGVFCCGLLCFVLYMLLMFYSSRRKNGKALRIAAIIFASLGCAITFSLSLFNLVRKITKGKTLDDFIYEDLTAFCDNINKTISKNLMFRFNKEEKYLECFVKNLTGIKKKFNFDKIDSSHGSEKRNVISNDVVNQDLNGILEDNTERKFTVSNDNSSEIKLHHGRAMTFNEMNYRKFKKPKND